MGERKTPAFMEKKLRLPVRPGVVVHLPPESHARQLRDWQHALVGKFIDELAPTPMATEDAVARLWHPAGAVRTVPCNRDRYAFKFDSADDKQRILAGGPYTVEGKLLALQPLLPCTAVDLVQFNRVPVWLTLTGLPVDLHCDEVALAVAEAAGHPTEAEVVLGSAACGPGRVRVRVEIEAEEPLLQGSYVDDGNGSLAWVGFEYEGIPRICRNCMLIGHVESDCKKSSIHAKFLLKKRLESVGMKLNVPVVNDPAAEAVFGSPKSRSAPPGNKVYGSAGAIVCADQAAAEGTGRGRAGGRRRAAEKTEEEDDEEELIVLPLSGPAADLNGPGLFGPGPYDGYSTRGPGPAQRGGSVKRKHRAEKVK